MFEIGDRVRVKDKNFISGHEIYVEPMRSRCGREYTIGYKAPHNRYYIYKFVEDDEWFFSDDMLTLLSDEKNDNFNLDVMSFYKEEE